MVTGARRRCCLHGRDVADDDPGAAVFDFSIPDIGNPNNAEVIDLAISTGVAAHPRNI
jgi:hypothetical protein